MTTAVPCSRASSSISSSGTLSLLVHQQRDARPRWRGAGRRRGCRRRRRRRRPSRRAASATSIARHPDAAGRPRASRSPTTSRRPARRRSRRRRRGVAAATARATRGCSGGRARARSSRPASRPSSSTIGTRSRSLAGHHQADVAHGRVVAGDGELLLHHVTHAQHDVGQQVGLRRAAALEHPAGLGVELAEPDRDVLVVRVERPAAPRSRSPTRSSRCRGCGAR